MTPNQSSPAPINSLVLLPAQDTNKPVGQQMSFIRATDLIEGTSSDSLVTTVPEFRASSNVPTNKAVITTDHGGGTWYYAGLSDGDVDDTGTTIITADNHVWKKLPANGEVNVKSFGAIGDGVTNDLAAVQAAVNFVGIRGGELIFPQGRYFLGYSTPLTIVGAGITIRGCGCPTNGDPLKGTSILGKIELGSIAESGHAHRFRMSDIAVFGPGLADPLGTSHLGVGITIIKGLESNFYNVAVEGFKYGVSPYDTPDAAILYAYSITFDHCRFYNNRICNFEWGRVGHALSLVSSNLSWSDYCLVFGVFDHSTDEIIWSNAEPNVSLNALGCVFQGWRKKGVVITNSKSVVVNYNYFELGKPNNDVTEPINIDSDEAIQLGSPVNAGVVYVGFEDSATNCQIEGNKFQTATIIYQYKPDFCCIRVMNARKGSIKNNALYNIPYPIHANDGQLGNMLLVRRETAKLDEGVVYESNSAVWGRETTEEYAIEDAGYASAHGSYMFRFVSDMPPYLSDGNANIMYYDGVRYDLFYLGGGTGPNSPGAQFGATSAQTLKFPQVLNPKTTIVA